MSHHLLGAEDLGDRATNNSVMLIIVLVAGVAGAFVIILGMVVICKSGKRKSGDSPESGEVMEGEEEGEAESEGRERDKDRLQPKKHRSKRESRA